MIVNSDAIQSFQYIINISILPMKGLNSREIWYARGSSLLKRNNEY